MIGLIKFSTSLKKQSPDMHLIDSQIKQLELLKNDLNRKDYTLLGQVNQLGETLLELSAGADYDELKVQLQNVNSQYDLLSNQFNGTVEFKQKLRDLCGQFAQRQQQFYDCLNAIDTRLNDLIKLDLCTVGNTTSLNVELAQIECERLNDATRLLDATSDCFVEIIDLNRNFLLLNGHPDLVATYDDDELNQKLNQMRNSLQTTRSNLSLLKSQLTQSLAKQKSLHQLYGNVREFINVKSEYLNRANDPAKLSCNLNKLLIEQKAHDKFIRELVDRGEDVKKLIEYFAELDDNVDTSSELEDASPARLVAELETAWNSLCAKSDSRKEKLFICYSMAEQFDSVGSFLTQYLDDLDTRPDATVQSLDQSTYSNNLIKMTKIGNELKQACHVDVDQVDERLEAIQNKYEQLMLKLKSNEFNRGVDEIKRDLHLLESTLADSSAVPSEHERRLVGEKLDRLANMQTSQNKTLDELRGLFSRLETAIEKKDQTARHEAELAKFHEDLSKMDDKLKAIQDLIHNGQHNDPNILILNTNSDNNADVNATIRHVLDSLNHELNSADESIKNYLGTSQDAAASSLDQLQQTVKQLTEKCKHLNTLQVKEEQTYLEKVRILDELKSQIDQCNADIVACSADIEQKLPPVDLLGANQSNMSKLLNDQASFEVEFLKPIKTCLDRINKQYNELVDYNEQRKGGKSSLSDQLGSLRPNLDQLNTNAAKLESKFIERGKQLDLAAFKSSKFEDKVKILDENLHHVEGQLTALSSARFNFDNLTLIDEHTRVCDQLIRQLTLTSTELDDFKEICEKLMQNCDNVNDRNTIEQRMDALVLRWSLLTKKLDEKRINLAFLHRHLNELNVRHLDAARFVNELNPKFISNVILNCIDPIVIKYQYEKMREINDLLVDNFHLISDLRANTTSLLTLHENYDEKLPAESSDNKYVAQLPKTISTQSVHDLSLMLDRTHIELRVNEIESRYNEYKHLLGENLNLMERLFPLCEKFSTTVGSLTNAVNKYELELEWLRESGENETSGREKETLYDELKKNFHDGEEAIVTELEGSLSARIIDELNTANSLCDEFITDLNGSIDTIRAKFNQLGEKFTKYETELDERRHKLKEIYAQIDDLLEWLDEVDTKFTNLDSISHEPDVIKNQLAEQSAINEEIGKQKDKLKSIIDETKSLIRTKSIDDSIELKEKLSGLQLQSNNLHKLGLNRLNELEQAYAIAKNFSESYKVLSGWFDEIGARLEQVAAATAATSADATKEHVKHELNVVKQIERNLNEKKIYFETLNKNGFALVKICNKNTSSSASLPYSTYGGSMLLSTALVNDADDVNTSLVKDCPSARHVKQLIAYANQRYEQYKDLVAARKDELETLIWRSADFTDKLDNLTTNLNTNVENYEYAEPISAHPDKLKLQIEDSKQLMVDLEKRRKALEDLKEQVLNNTEQILAQQQQQQLNKQQQSNGSSASEPMATKETLEKKISDLDELWSQLREVSEMRAKALEETLECSETFWTDFNGLMEVIGDLEERLRQIESETVAIDPDSVIEQQQYHEQIVRDIDENESLVNGFKDTGSRLIEMCGQSDQQEVERTVEELDAAWSRIKKLVRDREVDLQYTFGKACEFQQELIEILEWISLQQEKFVNLDSSFTSNDPKTIRFQIDLLKEFKEQVDPEQLKVQLLNQRFNDLKANTKTNQSFEVLESLQEPLNSANKEWKRLQSSIIERRSNLQNALLETGQFNDALDEMLKWLDNVHHSLDQIDAQTATTLTSNQLISTIDVQLAKLKVLQNDVKAQEQSVEKLRETGRNLIKNETTSARPGQNYLKDLKQRVQALDDQWTSLQAKLDDKQNTLSSRLNESQTFHCELQDTLVWLSEIESHLNSSKPFGGLPETAKEQLDKFMHVYKQIGLNEAKVDKLIERGRKESTG